MLRDSCEAFAGEAIACALCAVVQKRECGDHTDPDERLKEWRDGSLMLSTRRTDTCGSVAAKPLAGNDQHFDARICLCWTWSCCLAFRYVLRLWRASESRHASLDLKLRPIVVSSRPLVPVTKHATASQIKLTKASHDFAQRSIDEAIRASGVSQADQRATFVCLSSAFCEYSECSFTLRKCSSCPSDSCRRPPAEERALARESCIVGTSNTSEFQHVRI